MISPSASSARDHVSHGQTTNTALPLQPSHPQTTDRALLDPQQSLAVRLRFHPRNPAVYPMFSPPQAKMRRVPQKELWGRMGQKSWLPRSHVCTTHPSSQASKTHGVARMPRGPQFTGGAVLARHDWQRGNVAVRTPLLGASVQSMQVGGGPEKRNHIS